MSIIFFKINKNIKIRYIQLDELGRVTREEYTVIFSFSTLVLLWLFRDYKQFFKGTVSVI